MPNKGQANIFNLKVHLVKSQIGLYFQVDSNSTTYPCFPPFPGSGVLHILNK